LKYAPAAAALEEQREVSVRYGRECHSRGAFVLAHGTCEMPIWGEAFRGANRDEALVKIKVHNLSLYIESMQEK